MILEEKGERLAHEQEAWNTGPDSMNRFLDVCIRKQYDGLLAAVC